MKNIFVPQPIPTNISPDLQKFLQKMQLDIIALQTSNISKSIKTLMSNGTITIPKSSPDSPPVSLSDQYTIIVLGTATITSPSNVPPTMKLTRLDNGNGNFGVWKLTGYGTVTFTSTNQLTVIAIPL